MSWDPWASVRGAAKIEELDREPGGSYKKLTRVMVKTNRPVPFTDTSVLDWPATNKWCPKYLRPRMPDVLDRVRIREDGVYRYFNENQTFADIDAVVQEYSPKTYAMGSMTADTFWAAVLRKSGCAEESDMMDDDHVDPYYYWADGIASLPKDLRKDVKKLRLLYSPGRTRKNAEVTRYLWMGPENTTTDMHYDLAENVYVQIYGYKKFLLFPPSAWPALRLYPFLHPGAKHSQLDLDNLSSPLLPPSFLCEGACPLERAFEIHLNAGDVLYIPPGWAHKVVAMTHGVGVNIWTSWYEADMDAMVSAPLPVNPSWPSTTRTLALRLYLEFVLKRVAGNPSLFLRMLYETRYAPLIGRVPEVLSQRKRSYCIEHLAEMTEERYDEEWADDWSDSGYEATPSAPRLLREEEEEFNEHARPIEEAMLSVGNSPVRDLLLGNFVEVFVLNVVRKPTEVAPFLYDLVHC